jgi:hypothetical protein
MPEPHDHRENHIELLLVEPAAMSLYLRMYDVLRTHAPTAGVLALRTGHAAAPHYMAGQINIAAQLEQEMCQRRRRPGIKNMQKNHSLEASC